MTPGILYIVSTPIGNLEDLTVRAARILGEADAVLAEDTRRTSILLRHIGVSTPMVSLHQHNERGRETEVLSRLEGGATLALVSDAGTPLVSDPGERLVARVRQAGYQVVPIPGPSAVMAALVASGLPAIPFAFLGFPPRKGRERAEFLARVRASSETVVLFESPERTARLLSELASEPGGAERQGAVARELTKMHEEVRSGTVGELAGYYEKNPPRGEVTIVLAPAAESGADAGAVDDAAIRALGSALLGEGLAPSRAAREVARRLGVPRNRAYELVQELEGPPDASGSDPRPLR